jgi:hypothetical protein
MGTERDLLDKVEKCIEMVGNECCEQGAYYFWWEMDIQSRLTSLLLQEPPELYINVNNRRFALVHNEYSAPDSSSDIQLGVEVIDNLGNRLIHRELREGKYLDIWRKQSNGRFCIVVPRTNDNGTVKATLNTLDEARLRYEAEFEILLGQPRRNPARGKSKYDVVIFTPEIAREIIDDGCLERNTSDIQNPVLCAIEIEELYLRERGAGILLDQSEAHLDSDINKLKVGIEAGAVNKGYILLWLWSGGRQITRGMIDNLRQNIQNRVQNSGIAVCFCNETSGTIWIPGI